MEIEAARAVCRIAVKRGASWNQARRVWCWRVLVVRMRERNMIAAVR